MLSTLTLCDFAARQRPQVILSYGLGVDSTAILMRWILQPATRAFPLEDLVVLTAQTGDEWPETGRLVEDHVFPLLREHRIRTVQVARATASQRDGHLVLSDTRHPRYCQIDGAFKLSHEMLMAGTVPQAGGKRLCSVKAKGWPLDQWIKQAVKGQPFRHAVGFETGEMRRVLADMGQGMPGRDPFYPLVEWEWDRETCEDYLFAQFGVRWPKSACRMCPFALLSAAGRRRTLPRYLSNPDQAMMPLLMEYVAMALNPRQSLTPERRLHDLLADAPGFGPVLQAFETYLSEQPWAVYEVRRAFRARSDDMMRPANAVRSLRTLATGSRSEMLTVLRQQAIDRGAVLETSGGHHRAWILRRGLYYPCGEHTLIAAPAVVQDKANPHFDQVWATIHDTPTQLALIG